MTLHLRDTLFNFTACFCNGRSRTPFSLGFFTHHSSIFHLFVKCFTYETSSYSAFSFLFWYHVSSITLDMCRAVLNDYSIIYVITNNRTKIKLVFHTFYIKCFCCFFAYILEWSRGFLFDCFFLSFSFYLSGLLLFGLLLIIFLRRRGWHNASRPLIPLLFVCFTFFVVVKI